MPPVDRMLRPPGRGTDAASKGRPIPGNVFDDRMRQGPGCNRCLTFAPIASASFLVTARYVGAPTCVLGRHRGIYQSDAGFGNPSLDRSGCLPTATPSKPDNAPGGSRHPHRPDEFRPVIPWRVARQHCPPPLHRHDQLNMLFSQGHSQPDISTLLNRTLLLCCELDATGTQAFARAQRVVAHLTLHAARVNPVATRHNPLFKNLVQDRLVECFSLPRGE
jgi:hypothetical protein